MDVFQESYNSTMSNRSVDSGQLDYICFFETNFDTISGALFIVIFILSITGNIVLLCVLVRYENLKNVTNLFVLNLACSDLVFTVTLPFWAVYYLHHWVFGEFACKFMTAAYIIGMYSSIILLTAMTVDRFITVVYSWPRNPTKRRRCAIAACVAAWVISSAASMGDAMKVKVETNWDGSVLCEDFSAADVVNLGYYLQVSLLFFLPFGIIVFCYSAILKRVLQASNRKRYRTVVVVFCIVTAFFICWGPYNILLFIQALYKPKSCAAEERLYIANGICRIIAFTHCCMNPMLYMLSQKLRKHLLQLLNCEKARRNNERGTGLSTSVIQNVVYTTQNSAVWFEQPTK